MSNPFESEAYDLINKRRWSFFAHVLETLRQSWELRRVLDVGCGDGFFAGHLAAKGFKVTAIDARAENIDLLRSRHPSVSAHIVDVQQPGALERFADHDLLFCAGLVYHFDNPLAGIRALAENPAPLLFIETQLSPGPLPSFRLVEEGEAQTQGLQYLALVPTQFALVRLLNLFGRTHVYSLRGGPDHPQFHETARLHRLRGIFLAARTPIELPDADLCRVPAAGKGFHAKNPGLVRRALAKLAGR